jgi:uncharacterized membrane protein HdeD (DUF308 family)
MIGLGLWLHQQMAFAALKSNRQELRMSNTSAYPAHHQPNESAVARISGNWGWFVALGVLSIAAGCLALADVITFTLISVIFTGAALLVSGVFQVVHALARQLHRSMKEVFVWLVEHGA